MFHYSVTLILSTIAIGVLSLNYPVMMQNLIFFVMHLLDFNIISKKREILTEKVNRIHEITDFKYNKYKECKGLFEIHISVDPNQIAKLRLFCLENSIKGLLAVSDYGDQPNQLMISKWVNGSGNNAFDETENLVLKMKSYGLIIHRVKVEAMAHNEGVPLYPSNDHDSSHYFEFHVKIPINSSNEYNALNEFCILHGLGLSFSTFKETITALLTMRIESSKGLNYAEGKYNEWMKALKNSKLIDLSIEPVVQKEFCIYDNNITYDNNWLKTLK